MLLSACVQLSPAGAQVRLFREEQAAAVSACQSLGRVSVSSEDALRNATAALSGDTALIVVRETNGSFYIRGSVYRCADPVPVAAVTPSPFPSPPPPETGELLRKTAKCRDKGGAWDGHQCVIEIE